MSTYTIDRKTASRLLKVSLRTVDRHIKLKHLSSKVKSGRVWLNKDQILEFRDRQRVKGVLSIDNYVDKVDIPIDSADYIIDEKGDMVAKKGSVDSVYIKSRGNVIDETIQHTYKKLYEELLDKFNDKETELKTANYRIGQLEARLKYSIPMIEHRKQQALLLSSGENLKKQLENEKKQKVRVFDQMKAERFNKRIYFILALILILLQPLWLLFITW
ncbi:hypothetical protein HZA39_02955 [Candidatus Peregrinibacteria bacterium]|nr:hypothetical protein [Candidatus Peregrinibacteria bacterium]